MTTHVIYHHPCTDGTAAALAAYMALGDAATYHGANYNQPKPEIPDGSIVYLLDFSWPRADLEALAARSRRVIVLDHHKTAAEALAGFPGATFDMNKSGAVLAWEHFHPGQPVPRMFQLIQDRDLWRWEHEPDTRLFAAYLQTQPLTIEAMRGTYEAMQDPAARSAIFAAGRAVLQVERMQIERLSKSAYWVTLGDHRFVAVNAPIHQSEVAHTLLEKFPDSPFAAAFVQVRGAQRWSLRSRGDFDVSAVAKQYGGGGHAAAAGFTLATPV
jgi:oligoribonuclease NrnB/cAMP/cGMP phosphodiesterase (DHH superfamily)